MKAARRIMALSLATSVAFACGGEDDDPPPNNQNVPPRPSEGREIGETVSILGEDFSSWALISAGGDVQEVGLSMPMIATTTLAEAKNVSFALSNRAVNMTFFDHIQLDFSTSGHNPGPYLVPHFDIHFYGVTTAEQNAVNCDNQPMPDADHLPAPYFIPSTEIDPAGTCVPQMGVHAINPMSPELDPVDPQPFEEHLILGYDGGNLTFVEPMIAQSFFVEGKEAMGDIARPTKLGRSTLFPGKWKIVKTEDLAGKMYYEVVLYEFTNID